MSFSVALPGRLSGAVLACAVFSTGALAQRAALTNNVDEPGRLPYELDVQFAGLAAG